MEYFELLNSFDSFELLGPWSFSNSTSPSRLYQSHRKKTPGVNYMAYSAMPTPLTIPKSRLDHSSLPNTVQTEVQSTGWVFQVVEVLIILQIIQTLEVFQVLPLDPTSSLTPRSPSSFLKLSSPWSLSNRSQSSISSQSLGTPEIFTSKPWTYCLSPWGKPGETIVSQSLRCFRCFNFS